MTPSQCLELTLLKVIDGAVVCAPQRNIPLAAAPDSEVTAMTG